ncbi:hypothetical protein CR969_03190 [Candidatus Saccharibacteria bacterium]|nr:MAG: hypothetical protein CR969_03190 [Candidatus Saccharibacteria bacterium]
MEYVDQSDKTEVETNKSAKDVDLLEPITWNHPDGPVVHRGTLWYVLFGVTTLGFILLAIFVFKSITFAILVPIMAVAVITLLIRPPQNINYAISPKGIYIADKLYDFSEFKAFGVVEHQGQHSISLLPIKRFSPELTIYFPADKGEKIVDMLGARLPMQEVKLDLLEKIIHLIKL